MRTGEHEKDHVLPDGTTVHVRPIRPDDDERLLAMWDRTSERSRRLRFHGKFDLNDRTVKRFTEFDPDTQYALVATLGRGSDERIVGVSRFVVDEDEPTHAEFAALIEDAHQGRGIGTALVREVALAAYEAGVRTLSGDVLAENSRMLRLIRDLGFRHADQRDEQLVRSDIGLELGESFLEVVDESERKAARAALLRFVNPSSIAVVGASRDPQAIGGLVFRHVLHGGFHGVVYPVNPKADVIQSVRAYPSLEALPEVPDLMMVCVPAPLVNEVVDQAGELGVKAVCVVSAGFAETGQEGQDRQSELMSIARGHGLRIVGPNCMGLLNSQDDVRMNATFSDTFPKAGRLAFSSQSGALGLAVIDYVHALGLGLSTFVSVGNKVDISGNDLLLFWEEDPDTDVILLYLESFGNPRKFSRIARRISRHKPIVVVKSGRTTAGVRAASSHTAAVSAGDVAVEALFSQAGVLRTDTLEELFDVATLLSTQPLPRSNRVGIVTNAGGPGILAADACASHGLTVPGLSEHVREQLRGFLPAEAGVGNPVDMIASASPEGYRRSVEALACSDEVDAVFVIFVPAGVAESEDVAAALADASTRTPDDVPIVSVFMSARGMPAGLEEARIPSFAFPEDAARAMGRVARYAEWRAKPLGSLVRPDGIDSERARSIVEAALGAEHEGETHAIGTAHTGDPVATGARRTRPTNPGVWLSQGEADAVLSAYGVTRARARIVSSPREAAAAQRDYGAPVAVKVAAPIHKTDVGGIELGLESPEAVADAVRTLEQRLRDHDLEQHIGGYLVQEMIEDGIEMVVGVSHDPSFGPLVVTGLGGTLVELIRDVSVRITPLTDRDVDEMIDALRMKPLLEGYRGSEPADVPALKDLLYRISALVEDIPEVIELDLNPVFVRPDGKGAVAADVRMKVATG